MRRVIVAATILALLAGCGRAATRPVAKPVSAPLPRPAPIAAVATPTATAAVQVLKPDPALRIPILMYHVVGIRPARAPYPNLYVAPTLFAAQMAALAHAGYAPLTLQGAWDVWHGKAEAPAHPIVLSFDDGYAGVYENAVPVLKARGWPAVLNLQTGRLDIPGGLSDAQIRQMVADGWEIADHTVTHPDLTRVSATRLHAELHDSARVIRLRFGVTPRFFCYPAGRYNATVIAAVRAAGFLGATTTWPGEADLAVDGAYRLDRVRVNGGESAAALVAALRGLAREKPTAPPAAFPAR